MTQDSSSVELPNVGGSRERSLSLGVGIPHVGAMQLLCRDRGSAGNNACYCAL